MATTKGPFRHRAENWAPRLQSLLDLLPRGAAVADVGCDHALLACAAVATGRARRAVAIDRSPRALEGALRSVEAAGLEGAIEVRRGDGLEPLAPGEVDTVVVAGMGGRRLLEILGRRDPRGLGIEVLVLQPNRDEARVRSGLSAAGWGLVDEALPQSPARVFETMRFDASAPALDLTPLEARLGPHLLRRRPPAFSRLVQRWWDVLRQKPRAEVDPQWEARLEALRAGLDADPTGPGDST